ncbi:hypothetical protein TNCV_3250321 [Trichonephila clavipes]|nr:hypothetical protein TNCV_3250321 [Trichonephila clavipes]
MGPPMREREGWELDCPWCFKKSGKTKRKKKVKKDRKRQGLVVFGKRKKEDLGVLDRDADQGWSWTRIRKTPCGLDRDKLWRERLQNGATILARHRTINCII